jgi:hypothetical protein
MTERDGNLADVLDEFFPRRDEEQGDWDGVVADAHSGRRLRRSQAPNHRRRRAVLALAIVGALAVFTVVPALAVSQGWLFFRESRGIMTPRTHAVTLTGAVPDGSGSSWSLGAFMTDGGVCYGIAPSGSTGGSEAWACDIDISESSEPSRALGFLAYRDAKSGSELVAGETVASVENVEIELANGGSIKVSTIPAPESFQTRLRFYLAALPASSNPSRVVGKDNEGQVVGAAELVALKEGVQTAIGSSCAVVALDPNTGSILALASYPSYSGRAGHQLGCCRDDCE